MTHKDYLKSSDFKSVSTSILTKIQAGLKYTKTNVYSDVKFVLKESGLSKKEYPELRKKIKTYYKSLSGFSNVTGRVKHLIIIELDARESAKRLVNKVKTLNILDFKNYEEFLLSDLLKLNLNKLNLVYNELFKFDSLEEYGKFIKSKETLVDVEKRILDIFDRYDYKLSKDTIAKIIMSYKNRYMDNILLDQSIMDLNT